MKHDLLLILILLFIVFLIITIALFITKPKSNYNETILSTKNAFKFGFVATLGGIVASSLVSILIIFILTLIDII